MRTPAVVVVSVALVMLGDTVTAELHRAVSL